ncbi:MAG TPA: F0F1 ATP synthase subunit delta [Usitatibacter sp.]|jgi:F-type H+-transporting ATPase subunit delta|nr:F0F1 ATP synthase subunit delta [Usitatibacter sp.]
MAEIATVARPYAEAAFEAALDKRSLESTADSLQLLAAIARNEQMRSVLSDPRVSAAQKKELFADVSGGKLDEVTRNLLAVLVDNHREILIAEIEEQFEQLKREHDRVVKARITSAQPLSDQQRGEIVSALERRYGKKVEAEVDVDPQLLGGARVQVGDQVIHASVRDALGQMAAALAR